MKRIFVLFVVALMIAAVPVAAQLRHCENVGGVLMTNINLLRTDRRAGRISALSSVIWPVR
jgi:hypothetical protein